MITNYVGGANTRTVCRPMLAAALLFFIAAMPLAAPAQDYVLGEGDLIKITVYGNDDLATTARVSGEGSVNFPLVGEVAVAGLTVRDAEQLITGLLAAGYIIDPHVNIFVQEYRSKKVTVLGEVKKPGLYELNGSTTLLEMMSKAEGPTENAGDAILVKRRKPAGGVAGPSPDGWSYISVNRLELMEKGDPSANIQIMDGDSVYVTTGGLVYVMGEVHRPGAYKVEKDTTVMKAIALAGGLTDKAAPGRTALIRKSGGEERTSRAEMNAVVQPDDVITVPESFF